MKKALLANLARTFLVVVVALFHHASFGASHSWEGTTSAFWTVGSNWTNGTPTAGDDLYFVDGNINNRSNYNNFPADFTFGKITINEGNPFTKDYYAFIGDGYRGQIWEQETKQLRELRDFIHAHGGKLMVVTFPFVNAVGPKYPYAAIHQQLDDFWKAENVPHLDLLSVYKDQPATKLTVNRFDAHPNEYAHQLATDAIEKFVAQNLSPMQKQ